MTAFESIQISPFCAHLCSKKLLFQQHPPRREEDLLDASCHTWCGLTQEALGPDQQPTDPDDCRAGRACFKSYSGS
jgi:hypothetical protein